MLENKNIHHFSDVQPEVIDLGLPENTDIESAILKQLNKTIHTNKTILTQVNNGIFLLTINKNNDLRPLQIKKITDRIQYAILPTHFQTKTFFKLSLNQIKNTCYLLKTAAWYQTSSTLLYVFFCLDELTKQIINRAESDGLIVKKIDNRELISISNNKFKHTINPCQLISYSLWQNKTISEIIDAELNLLKSRWLFYENMFNSLKEHYFKDTWQLLDNQIKYGSNGIFSTMNYQALFDDIHFCGYENKINEYLKYFRSNDLDHSFGFPTVVVRSMVYLKARPQVLSSVENGYVICAAKENLGKQSPVLKLPPRNQKSFSLWLKRASRYLNWQSYRARVIYDDINNPSVVSLIGEQVSSIAIFPTLIQGALESLSFVGGKSVRLIANNENILTIAKIDASWRAINDNNQKAHTLFKMTAHDGADSLALFEQVMLPDHGAGKFSFQIVPKTFFELIDAALHSKESMPQGHDNYLLGLAFECIHEEGLAIEQFQKALRLDNNDADILNALGGALMEQGKVKEALPLLKRAFSLLPDDPEVATNCGESSIANGHLEDAISAFEKAVRLCPGSAMYLSNLGQGYFQAKRNLDAIEILTQALKCDPEFYKAHATMAYVHLDSGNEEMAKKHAFLAYQANPSDNNIAKFLWRLTVGKNSKKLKEP